MELETAALSRRAHLLLHAKRKLSGIVMPSAPHHLQHSNTHFGAIIQGQKLWLVQAVLPSMGCLVWVA